MTRQAKPSRYIPACIRRSLANLPCAICGAKLKEPQMHVDHIVALSDGGETVRSNLRKLCFLCNQRRKHVSDDQVANYVTAAERDRQARADAAQLEQILSS